MNHGLSRGFRCGVPPRQTQTNNDASGSPQRVAGRPLTSQTAFGGQLPYKGSLVRPAAIFGHSRSEYNGKFLRATNNEPRATIFSRAEGHSRRCRHSESVAAKRHLSPRRHANCQLRPAGPSGPIFDERRTTYDERLFRPQCTICEIFFLLFMGELRTIGLYYFKIQCKGRG